MLDNAADSQYVAHVLTTWAKRYVGRKSVASAEHASLEPGRVIVAGRCSGMLQQVLAGRHRLIADEPEEDGGSDAGPNPYELLFAGLGSCTAMTLRMYADRKIWPLDQLRVYLSHAKVHAKDCETKKGRTDKIERILELDGALSDQQRERLVEIADRCPVSRTLQTETKIETRLR